MRRTPDNLSGTLLDERTTLTLHEFSRACGVRAEVVIEMVHEGVLDPRGAVPDEWRFPGSALTRAHKALRLTRDLHVNWPGVALALDLIQEIERLRRRRRRGYYQVTASRQRGNRNSS